MRMKRPCVMEGRALRDGSMWYDTIRFDTMNRISQIVKDGNLFSSSRPSVPILYVQKQAASVRRGKRSMAFIHSFILLYSFHFRCYVCLYEKIDFLNVCILEVTRGSVDEQF